MDAASGRRRGRAEKYASDWGLVQPGCRPPEQLTQGVRASGNTASDEVRILFFELRRRLCRASHNELTKTGSEALHLRFDAGGHVDPAAIGNVAIGPCGVAAGRRSRSVEQAWLCQQHKRSFGMLKYTDRFTANNVIGKLFPELAQEVSESVEAPHLGLTLSQSDRTVVPGSRVTLIAEVQLPPGVHVYAPGVKGYRPIQLVLTKSEEIESRPVSYPNSKMLYFEPIQERVPVFEGRFHITQDVMIGFSKAGDGVRALLSSEKNVAIAGELRYQACTSTLCYPPTSAPVRWELKVEPLELRRSPGDIRHK